MMRRGRSSRRGSRKGETGRVGRLFEGMAVLVLLLIVLTFGVSIASRFLPEEESVTVPVRGLEPLERSSDYDARVVQRANVEVRNGCGYNGLASVVGLELRGAGFDVVEWKDANRYDYQTTLVVAGGPYRETGEAIRDYLQRKYGIGELRIEPGSGGVVDVQVILGADLVAVRDEIR